MRIGCDLVYIPKIKDALAKPEFLRRVFTQEEVSACDAKQGRRDESLAARFAAKEAFAKALGTGMYAEGISFKDVWVQNQETGRPYLCLTEAAKRALLSQGLSRADVSLSHHGEYAMATVVLF